MKTVLRIEVIHNSGSSAASGIQPGHTYFLYHQLNTAAGNLLHIGGDVYPKINNKPVDSVAGVKLKEGDVVEVGENLAEISFP